MNAKKVNGFPEYLIYEDGKVFSTISNRFLTPSKDSDGYLIVHFHGKKYSKSAKVHRLVAEAFVKNPNNYTCVNHKDENKTNNNAKNLEWCSVKYNNSYGTRLSRVAKTRCTPVIQISNGKEYVWESVSTCCEKLNIKKTTLYHALRGGWKTKGCYWKWGNK